MLGLTILLLTGCGIIQGDPARTGGNGVVVTPDHANVRAGDTLQFTAQVTGGGAAPASSLPPRLPNRDSDDRKQSTGRSQTQTKADGQMVWAVNSVTGGNPTLGTISTSGLYTAPAALPNPASVQVTATRAADQASSGEAAITLENPTPVLQSVQPDPVTVGSFTLTLNVPLPGRLRFWES